jgi:hypothetical protein
MRRRAADTSYLQHVEWKAMLSRMEVACSNQQLREVLDELVERSEPVAGGTFICRLDASATSPMPEIVVRSFQATAASSGEWYPHAKSVRATVYQEGTVATPLADLRAALDAFDGSHLLRLVASDGFVDVSSSMRHVRLTTWSRIQSDPGPGLVEEAKAPLRSVETRPAPSPAPQAPIGTFVLGPGMRTCPDCAEDVTADSAQCRYCGYVFEWKTCPDCAEEVKAAARICRFCRYEFPQMDATQMLDT